MSALGTLERLVSELGQALGALEDVLTPQDTRILFASLGIDDPSDLSGDAIFMQKLSDAAQKAAALAPQIETIIAASESGDDTTVLTTVAQLIAAIGELAADLGVIASDLSRAAAGTPGIDDFALEFVEKVLDAAIVTYLENVHPFARRIASLLTITELEPFTFLLDQIPVKVSRAALHLERIPRLLTDPLSVFRDAYGWGTPSFDGDVLFRNARDVFDMTVLPAVAEDPDEDGPAGLELFNLLVRATTGVTPPGLEAGLFVDLPEKLDLTLAQLSDEWRLGFELGGSLDAGARARLLPPAEIRVLPLQGRIEGDVAFALVGQAVDPTTPFVLFGQTGGSRLQALKVRIAVGATLTWDIVENAAKASGGFELVVQQGKLVIDTSKSDGFLQKILPSDGLHFDFDFDLGWSSARGFFFTGSAGLELAFALNLTLGPFRLDTVHLIVGVANDGLGLEASVDGGGTLGPVSASIERIGLALHLAFTSGNLGPVDLQVGFKYPTGLGLQIDAGPITGGGFVDFDPPNGRYSGVLALSLYSIQVKAIGLIDTKLPNGESGFSFLVIISVEFTPIQLGFGFTLNGVGGLCGINRGFITDAIQAGLRQHSLDHILFPKDPVKNAPAIISDLRAIFPPAEGRYVFGPMLEIGWGGGLNLVTAELGVLLALPSPVVIAILGQFHVNLPNPNAPIVELHLDVLGIVDFGKKLFSLDASLHDSRIVVFTIFGDMAMRLSWGENPSFALAIGGLNPHFQPPPGFPELKRLTIALSSSDDFRLSIQTYFAITSNTFQLGAKAELYVGVSEFNVYGWLGFDALIIFKPFSFTVDFTAGLALRSGTSTLLGITLDGTLSGPTPWHATGEGHVSLLFFDIGVHVDITWGESRTLEAPPSDVWPELRAAIANVQNWSGALPAGVPSVCTLAKPDADTSSTVLVDPSAVLTMRERVCPLNQTLTKFGESVPGPQTTFTLDGVSLGGQPAAFTVVRDKFAPAQFEELSDQDKLSRPSFEDRDAGLAVGDGLVAIGQGIGLGIAFEDVYVDDKAPPPPQNPVRYTPALDQQLLWAQTSASSQSALRAIAVGKFTPPAGAKQLVTLEDETFVVATTTDLTARADITAPTTKGEAYRALAAHLLENPAERDLLQVVPVHELAA